MSAQSEFFLGSRASVVQLETLEISHPSFSQTYRIVRNAVGGIDIGGVHYDYYPLRITPSGTRETLDFGITGDLGDLGEVIPAEIDRAMAAGTMATKPTVVYRTYRSDTLELLFGPVTLEIADVAMTREGASFEARASSLNVNRTGEIYALERFPMLRSFL